MNIRRLYRKAIWQWRLWRMHRQLPRSQAEIMRDYEAARKSHKPSRHLHRQLMAHVNQDLRS